ncbi:MAG: hypothetical protein QOI38_382 [Sphingomonadales bacterium]|jgi:hypothetical protein|nr:hypothetical protein [Sphingomonadales bacterium]
MKFSILLACALAAWPSAAAAADWRLVTVNGDIGAEYGLSLAGFVDYDSVTREGPVVTFRLVLVSEVPTRSGMDNARALIEADCPPGRYRHLERTFYGGDQVLDRIGADGPVEAEPQSTIWLLIEAACNGVPSDSPRVQDPYRSGQAELRARRQPRTQ